MIHTIELKSSIGVATRCNRAAAETMFQRNTTRNKANFLAVAGMGDTLPFLKFILVKKSLRGVDSLRFPIALAAFRRAIFNLMLSFYIFLEIILPPVFLLSGDSLRKDVNCLAFFNSFQSNFTYKSQKG